MKRLIAIVGATCSGKTTLAHGLVAHGCAQVISTTTRDPRPGERHGHDYWFVDDLEFLELKFRGDLVEEAFFGGRFYGISRSALYAAFGQSDTAVAVVTPEGRLALERWCAEHRVAFRSVFVTARASVLRKRLKRERPDGAARRRDLLEQVRQWRRRAHYDLVLPGRRAATAAEEVLAQQPA